MLRTSAVQGALVAWFRSPRREWAIRAMPELRMRVSATRYRIPDVCVIPLANPVESVFTHPPLVCIEVLSPEDRESRLLERVADYRAFGIQHTWIIDPARQRGFECLPEGLRERARFRVPDSPIYLDVAELFADLD